MKSLSYTRSIILTSSIQSLDELRKQILLIPLPPQTELKLQWESANLKIQYLLALGGKIVTAKQIEDGDLEAKSYRTALDYLYHHWLVNSKTVVLEDLLEFYQSVFPKETLTGDEEELKASLQYIQINPEHPIVQAALAQILVLSLSPFSAYNEQFSHLIFLLFMYKYGYDMKRFPVYEEQYVLDLTNYKNMILQSNRLENVTSWLEYVCQRAIFALQKTLSTIQQINHNPSRTNSLFSLNERQEHIMNLFSVPGAKISNRIIQKKCKVSQITASRDLAKLADSGLIFAIGKGRSTYYTKV
jgi:hypothetical protein